MEQQVFLSFRNKLIKETLPEIDVSGYNGLVMVWLKQYDMAINPLTYKTPRVVKFLIWNQ